MGADYAAGQALPTRNSSPAGSGLPARTAGNGGNGSVLPSRNPGGAGGSQHPAGPLPTRTTKFRRGGRHSSPYQLSLPPTAPALVLAVPGPPSAESDQVAGEVAAAAGNACPGAEVRVGYLEGDDDALTPVLGELPGDGVMPSAVVVPLLAGPHPAALDAIGRAASAAHTPVIVTDPLGPHPLLAEVMHVRLSEGGLARAGRAGRISVGNDADGVIVLAAGGPVAVQSVGVVAVLLASRLAIPVDAASLGDPSGAVAAAERLRGARVTKLALAPCFIGPEAAPGELAAIQAATRLECAAPLGAHAAIGHLAAIRYGAALDDPSLANLVG